MSSESAVSETALTTTVTRELDIGLYPQFMGAEGLAVNKLLRQRKFIYDPEYCRRNSLLLLLPLLNMLFFYLNGRLNGIMLRYSNLEFLDKTGRIIDDGPMIVWRIKANFTIFNVKINQLVRAKISR